MQSPLPEWCGAGLYAPVVAEDGRIVAESRRMCGLKEPHEWHQDRYDATVRWKAPLPFVERSTPALDLVAEAVRRADRAEAERDEARRSCDMAWEDRRAADLALEREKQERAPLRAEIRQLREAMSHHRQIAEHYRDALAAVLSVRSHVSYPHTFDFDAAMSAARVALDNPPEWNGVLHA